MSILKTINEAANAAQAEHNLQQAIAAERAGKGGKEITADAHAALAAHIGDEKASLVAQTIHTAHDEKAEREAAERAQVQESIFNTIARKTNETNV